MHVHQVSWLAIEIVLLDIIILCVPPSHWKMMRRFKHTPGVTAFPWGKPYQSSSAAALAIRSELEK